MEKEVSRFISYCEIDTQSNSNSNQCPSEAKELELSRKLLAELKELGVPASLNEFGIIYGKLEGEKGLDAIGFNAHIDTAEEITGKGNHPRYIENYDGDVIQLNETYSLSPQQFPTLKGKVGHDLVVTNGNTLLGADDKAGIAIIMSMLEYYVQHPEQKHHTICFCFTPDEEIGRGPDHFDAKTFGADYAYTIDGGDIHGVSYENFNAAHALITIHGLSVHPGEAKGKMVNAASLACELDKMLPEKERPQYTSGYEGFLHLVHLEGSGDLARLGYIIRDHDASKLEARKKKIEEAVDSLRKKYPAAKIELEIGNDYRNMKEILDKDPRALRHLEAAYQDAGVSFEYKPTRGGTDGATFSFKGCPTPNLGTGSYNHHGRFEYLDVNDFMTMIEVAKSLVKVSIQ